MKWAPCFGVKSTGLFPNGNGESLEYTFRDGPHGDSIATEFGAKDILMEFNEGVDFMLSCQVDPTHILLEIGLIELALLELVITPSQASSDCIDSLAFQVNEVFFVFLIPIKDEVQPVKYSFPSF